MTLNTWQRLGKESVTMDCFQCLTLAFSDYSWMDLNTKSDNLELGWLNLLKIIIELLNISAKKTDSEYALVPALNYSNVQSKLWATTSKRILLIEMQLYYVGSRVRKWRRKYTGFVQRCTESALIWILHSQHISILTLP